MKQYIIKLTGLATLALLIAGNGISQDSKKEPSKHSDDIIIIKPKTDIKSKVTIEINGGDVLVNGKPLSEFKDDNVTISKRKNGTIFYSGNGDMRELKTPASRFRGGTSFYDGGDNMTLFNEAGSNKAFLGVTTEKSDDGAEITDVTDESAAEKAGLKEGDVITKINDTKVEGPEDLTKTIGKFKPEDKVTVTIKRDKKEQKISATLTKRKNAYAFSTFPDNNFNYNLAPFAQNFGSSWSGSRSHLGLKAQETEDGKGLKVLDVDDESVAEKAGIKEGDIITEFDGTEVNNIDKLRELAHAALNKVSFKVKLNRDGKQQEVDVKIPKNLKTTNL